MKPKMLRFGKAATNHFRELVRLIALLGGTMYPTEYTLSLARAHLRSAEHPDNPLDVRVRSAITAASTILMGSNHDALIARFIDRVLGGEIPKTDLEVYYEYAVTLARKFCEPHSLAYQQTILSPY